MEKRHKHVSPTLDIMAKKIFSLPEVTVAFIRDILALDVVDAQILEGTQLHKKDFDEDELFSTSVDVRAKLNDGTEVIIEIQVRKQHYFSIVFIIIWLTSWWKMCNNYVNKGRPTRCMSRWSRSMA